jgi:hypothetical protein
MLPETAANLFALISVDVSLPKKRKRGVVEEASNQDALSDDDEEREEDGQPTTQQPNSSRTPPTPNAENPAENLPTYQNYKSALKWWHKYSSEDYNKIGYAWPEAVDEAINKATASYKRDVGKKKRLGIMKQKEGKDACNLKGYLIICKFFGSMKPAGKKYTWVEGIFAGHFTKLSVNTLGRSDNIDDFIYSNMGWENDALTIQFGTTKPDQSGVKTSEKKRIFANPFKPEICCILALAVYTWCKRRSKSQQYTKNQLLFQHLIIYYS